MRKVTLSVAATLDGLVARRDGSMDWLPAIQTGDGKLLAKLDTVVMGRRTYELAQASRGPLPFGGLECIVFSRRRAGTRERHTRFIGDDPAETIRELRAQPGRGIWLVGGGEIVRECLDAGVVNEIVVSIVPVLLGDGVPLFLSRAGTSWLELRECGSFPDGVVRVTYGIRRRPPRVEEEAPGANKPEQSRVAAAAVGAEMVRAWALRTSAA